MTNPIHSYSTLSTFEQCPHKYFRLKIKKDVKEDFSGPAIEYGKSVHKALENYLTLNIPIPNEHAAFRGYAQMLRDQPGEKHIEHRVALDDGLNQVGFFDNSKARWRAVFDYVAVSGENAMLIDHKTGKVRPTKQLHLASAVAFNAFPTVNKIRAAFTWLKHGSHTVHEFTRDDEPKLWETFRPLTDAIAECVDSNVWPYKTGPLCAYCPVKDCPHNESHARGG